MSREVSDEAGRCTEVHMSRKVKPVDSFSCSNPDEFAFVDPYAESFACSFPSAVNVEINGDIGDLFAIKDLLFY